MQKAKTISPIRYAEQSIPKKAFILTLLTVMCAAVGWIAETVLFLFQRGTFVDRGLLTLPFCPVYGLGMLLTYFLFRTPQSGFWDKWRLSTKTKTGRMTVTVLCVVLYAALSALLATAIEYLTGAFFHKFFGVRLWSYHNHENNFGGYVCLGYSLMWGVLAVVYMGLVWYPLMQLLARADTAVLAVIAIILATVVASDFVFNILYLHLHGSRFMPFG